jgi:heme exporter protein A
MTNDYANRLLLRVAKLTRRFGSRTVFSGLDFECGPGDSVCLAGPNGSGKSTLLRIIAGLLAPTSGSVMISIGGREVNRAARRRYLGLVSPESNLYDELTGLENLLFLSRVSGRLTSRERIEATLNSVGLAGRGDDVFGEYSSGMKQRLKLASVLLSGPLLLLLDEPTSNLDDAGKELVYSIMQEQRGRGILVYATNERNEERLGDRTVRLA